MKSEEYQQPTINVIDSVMGAGKTSYAIQLINESLNKILYITPFLDEVKRICRACKPRRFVEPHDKKGETKSEDLKNLLAEGRNISTTHALFKLIDFEAMELIKAQGYVLIMDEVMDVLSPIKSKKDEIEALFEKDVLKRNPQDHNKNLCRVLPGPESRLTKYKKWHEWAATDRLILINDHILMWLYPSNIFSAFKQIWNLCYLFDGALQKAYYDLHGLSYNRWSVFPYKEQFKVNGRVIEKTLRYEIIEYRPHRDDKLKKRFKKLINIYEGNMNQIGQTLFDSRGRKKNNPFSKKWYWKTEKLLPQIKKNLNNFFTNLVKSKVAENLWTTFKDYEVKLKDKRYGSQFLPWTQRSINKYRHTKNLAYLVNLFLKLEIEEFFKTKNVKINKDLYALSEMIQWIWRSRIREFKPINLYIPSDRMRDLLVGWLDSEEKIIENFESKKRSNEIT